MQFEDPRFLFLNIIVGAVCAYFHAPLLVVMLSCIVIGVLAVPPFVLAKSTGFWASYRPSNFALLKSLFQGRSNIAFEKLWVVILAFVLLACCAGIFGLVMTETLLPRVSNFVAFDRPFMPVGITMVGIYALFRGLIWWARTKQISK